MLNTTQNRLDAIYSRPQRVSARAAVPVVPPVPRASTGAAQGRRVAVDPSSEYGPPAPTRSPLIEPRQPGRTVAVV
jgi:hypothetical protein